MLLCLDTSSAQTTLALAEDGRLLASVTAFAPSRHEESLLPALDRLLASVGRERGAVRTVGVGLGPGGFTSLRVGIASAQGLALGLGAQLVGVGSLRVLARGLASSHVASAVLVDAGRGEVYGAVYTFSGDDGAELVAPLHGPVVEVARRMRAAIAGAPVIVGGDALVAHADAVLAVLGPSARRAPRPLDLPQPVALLLETEAALRSEGPTRLDRLEPHYVRPSDAKLPVRPLRTSLAPE